MSTFIDCIKSAVESGRIKPAKGAEAEAAFQREFENGVAEGLTETAARDAAALRAVEAMTKLTGEKRWRRLNEIRKAHDIYQRFSTSKNLPRELDDFMDEVDVGYERVKGEAMALMNGNLEKYRPRMAGLIHPVRDMDEIVYAAYGEAIKNPSSKELADEINNVNEFLRKRANMEGASIPENPNRRLPQTHDRLKVRQVPKEVWVNEHLGRLDWDLMRYNDKPIPVTDRVDILGRVHDAIITDGYNRITPGHTSSEHLASRLSRNRFLYYKDAKSYLDMQKKYGSGNMFQQTIAHIDIMSRDIIMLEKMGPNPNGMRNYLANTVKRTAAEADIGKGATKKKSALKKADEALNLFDKRYDMHNLMVLNGEENAPAQMLGTARTAVMSTILSGSYLFNLGDIGFMKQTAFMHKLPMMGHTRAYIKNFIPNKQNRELAIRSGLIAESATTMAASYQRYFGPLDGAHWARRYSDVIHRAGLLTPHTQAARWAWGMELMGVFADEAGKKFDDLPFVELFRKYGITEEEWDLFRQTAVHEDRGAKFLRPIDLRDTGSTQARRVADKFLDVIHGTSREAVPAVTGRVRATLGNAETATSLMGQLGRTVGALKSFPTTLMFLHGRNIMRESGRNKLKYGASFFLFLTAAGAFVTQLREMAGGRDPLPMDNLSFWARAALNGGSMGILGDMVFNNLNMGRSGLSENITGPMVQFADDIRNITVGNLQQVIAGEDTKIAAESIRLMQNYGPRVWQLRLLINRYIYEELSQQLDPAGYRRRKAAQERWLRERGQGQWWGSGNRRTRAPDLSNALGAD